MMNEAKQEGALLLMEAMLKNAAEDFEGGCWLTSMLRKKKERPGEL